MTSIIEERKSLHKRLADQKEQKNTLELQAAKLQVLANIGETTCMIAHEINNLLTPISNYADLALKNSEDTCLAHKALEKTVFNCNRASQIMQSMLALANGESQKKKDVRLIELIDKTFMCLCRDFKKDGITVHVEVPDSIMINAVEVQLQQVLMNLVLNAREAMLPRGGILSIKADENEDVVIIEVSDTGKGIKSEDIGKIFEPFYSSKKNKDSGAYQSGAGLGLSFCKKVIEKHNGSICAESQPNQKTIFKITLPK